jgi:hypothetical protein
MTSAEAQTRADEVAEKLERTRGYLADAGRSGVLLTRQFLVSWITGGMEDVILRGQDGGFVWAVVTQDGAYLVTSNIEARRLRAEEGLDALGFEVIEVPWYEGHFESAIGDLADIDRLANDGSGPGEVRARMRPTTSSRFAFGSRPESKRGCEGSEPMPARRSRTRCGSSPPGSAEPTSRVRCPAALRPGASFRSRSSPGVTIVARASGTRPSRRTRSSAMPWWSSWGCEAASTSR